MTEIQLLPLEQSDREQFIRDNQDAFNYGALQEFGLRNERFEEEGEIISRETIEHCLDEGTAYRIMQGEQTVGGIVIKTKYDQGELELLFVSPAVHSKGIGFAAWCQIEQMHPEVTVWETVTPYFEKRNIHFYVNRCGFHIVEFYNEHHHDPADQEDELFEMFRFEKILPETPEAMEQQISRIMYYEDTMQRIEQKSVEGSESKKMVQELSAYYSSTAWKRDFAADEAGQVQLFSA